MKRKVLWIEDGAFVEVANLAGPVYASAKYDLVVATNAYDAINHLFRTKFDAVVVDVRIPPGNDPDWEKLYDKNNRNKKEAQLGIQVLYRVLEPESANEVFTRCYSKIPEWVEAGKFAVFTIENKTEIEKDLTTLKVENYCQKEINMKYTALLDIIETIITESSKTPGKV